MFQHSNDPSSSRFVAQNCTRTWNNLLKGTLTALHSSHWMHTAFHFHLTKGLTHRSSSNMTKMKGTQNPNPIRKAIEILYMGFSNAQSRNQLLKTNFSPTQRPSHRALKPFYIRDFQFFFFLYCWWREFSIDWTNSEAVSSRTIRESYHIVTENSSKCHTKITFKFYTGTPLSNNLSAC